MISRSVLAMKRAKRLPAETRAPGKRRPHLRKLQGGAWICSWCPFPRSDSVHETAGTSPGDAYATAKEWQRLFGSSQWTRLYGGAGD